MAGNRPSGKLDGTGEGRSDGDAQRHEFEIISLGSNRRHMDLPEYRAAIREAEAVQEATPTITEPTSSGKEKNGTEKEKIISFRRLGG